MEQFRSHGFNLIYCSYENVLQAFDSEGVDVSSEENSSDQELQGKVDAFGRLDRDQRERISAQIRELHSEQFARFFNRLRDSLGRHIECVFVLPLSGSQHRFESIQEAVSFIASYDPSTSASQFVKYELNIRYSNGDEIKGTFRDKQQAIDFLKLNEG